MKKDKNGIPRENTWYSDLRESVDANMHVVHEHFDLEFTRQLIQHVISRLRDLYFRARYIGFEHYPERNNPDRPLIFASNHSGMAFPWDGIILAAGIYEMFDYGKDAVRPLASPSLSESILMNPYLYKNLWKIVGSVDASFLNFETMLHQNDHNLLIYPEGVPGIGKGFDRRYELQRFSSSFITMSVKYKTDIVPILTVNGEYINPYAYKIDGLNKLVSKIGVPFLPLGPTTPFLLLQPWVFYMAYPARLTYVMGRRLSPWKMTDKTIDQLSYSELLAIKERVRSDMQEQLDEAVAAYGEKPFDMRGFYSVAFSKQHWRNLLLTLPVGWPLLFTVFRRAWDKTGGCVTAIDLSLSSVLKAFFYKTFYVWFYIPVLGWIPILIAGVRKVVNTPNHKHDALD
jgi:1-acyl-sn-glycerol-3-phosphate acyltransferase